MLYTPTELATAIGDRIRARRKAMGLTQADSASRAGVSYRTWRRMEGEGKASIDDLVRAALVLRCEDGVTALFPLPAAASMDALLRDQRQGRR
ncbi:MULTISPECIES: helix-turn-helix domain-containing protein [unclassified Sphingomonas]|uniref:helix-turn-helix domain-containing protein n=1 Tax=unclassified Sphingomonas TaxID=196159 RepID=UPI0006F4992F|nr:MULTISPECIES: helix-turn-helix transcriptional regulator [unclassified Sphingomonas]KQM63174.1 DNA-binding protein [Sphingomonas sp. Leaf16]KQN14970.1 DNA-binding protein [Sphingomonas sp. Leaf29]KQN20548.1 DNA-binding protein [Sphingomonas sp. Leaf32]